MKKLSKSIMACLMVLCVSACSSNSEETENTISSLKSFTDYEKESDMISFGYGNNSDSYEWILKYTNENEFVTIHDDRIVELFTELDGVNSLSGDSELSYDFSENEARIYFNEDLAGISILSYNLGNNEYTVNQDGERYEISPEFLNYLEDKDFDKLVQEDLDSFEDCLKNNNLSLEDISNLRFNNFS